VSVAKVIEITSTSTESFEDAIRRGIAKAGETVREIRGAWVKEQNVTVENGNVASFRVDLKITFVLD
jgi:dodecin